uniref:Ig-like domain-containing protein n=1 Tax=Monodelphis domestica TaxID=13616 RepID=F6TIB4_MONDO
VSMFAALSKMGFLKQFVVLGPTEPIVALLGTDIILPCLLSPLMSAEHMEVRWFRSQFSEAVIVFQKGKEETDEQLVEYTGRTELISEFITEGRLAVKIYNVQISDNGKYQCYFRKGDVYEQASLEVKVAGLGSAPHLRLEGHEDGGVKLACMADGWFPQPQVQWRDNRGGKLSSLSETQAQDEAGFFHMKALIVVQESSVRNVSCSICNKLLSQEKISAIDIPEQFKVLGPTGPIVAILDTDVTLPCRLSPLMNAEHMDIRWLRSQFYEAVFVFQNGREQVGEQLVEYMGRTEFISDFIKEGRVAVKIYNVKMSDNGEYQCIFQEGDAYEKAVFEVKVASLGSAPRFHLEGYEDGGIRLVCSADGWFPQPQVQCRDNRGGKLSSLSETQAQDEAGFFHAKTVIVVQDSSVRNISCSIYNLLLGQGKVSTIDISG